MKFETKKFVKKITAVASAALMTMMPISGALATADLSALTSTFITEGEFDTYIAVGTCTWNTAITCENSAGMAKDIAGAIEVAAAFAQQAKTTSATSGTAVLERNTTAGHLNNSYSAIGAGNEAQEWISTSTGFSWIANKTVTNSTNDEFANVTGKLSVTGSGLYQKEDGRVYIGPGAIIYNLTFNSDLGTTGNKGVGNATKGIPFPDGQEYQIINYTSDGNEQNVTLGALESITAELNTAYDIGDSGVTVEITAATETPQARMLIKEADGTVLVDNKYWSEGGSYSSDALGITINLKTLKVLTDGTVDAVIDWTTSTLKLLDSDSVTRESSTWPNWTIHIGDLNDEISSIAWKYYNQLGTYVNAGSELQLLGGFFKVTTAALKINSTTKDTIIVTVNDGSSATTGTGFEVTFTDENDSLHYVDLGLIQDRTFSTATNETTFTWLENRVWKLECIGDGSQLNLSNSVMWSYPHPDLVIDNGTPFVIDATHGNITGYTVFANVTWDTDAAAASGCVSRKVNLTVMDFTSDVNMPIINNSLVYNLTAVTEGLWQSSPSSLNGTLTLTENNTDTVTITWTSGDIALASGVDTTDLINTIASVGSTIYTIDWGTKLTRVSGTQVIIEYPDAPRIGDISLGKVDKVQYNLTAGEYSSRLDVTLASAGGTAETVNAIAIGLAKLDTEITTSTLAKPIILVGGPAVNQLVKSLVDENKSRASADYEVDRAYVELVENAFNNKTAMVIAGYAGKDTRLAAQVVASQALGVDMGLTGTNSTLNTAGATYSDVTVV